ncbi:MAG TPA: class I SAM-dependent methyltransferase [Beijerinckiaceae bacterium]|nr:class I SAM-dependent methyltransferase [Beijerinckiaceae bacterium]
MNPQNDQQSLAAAQFGPQAAAYVASPVHARGADLDHLANVVRGRSEARVLDLGCGGGHVGFHVAAEVASVVAYDLSSDMLAAVQAEARARGLANIACRQGPAESLPFGDAEFDFVFCRFSAHHWPDVPRALREARRVLKPQGTAIFIDVFGPDTPVLDTFLQTIEMLRDPSHVRNYSVAQWQAMAAQAGFAPRVAATHRLPLDFAAWVARMNTPELHVRAIRSLQARVAEDVRAHFEVAADGSFTIDVMTLELNI